MKEIQLTEQKDQWYDFDEFRPKDCQCIIFEEEPNCIDYGVYYDHQDDLFSIHADGEVIHGATHWRPIFDRNGQIQFD